MEARDRANQQRRSRNLLQLWVLFEYDKKNMKLEMLEKARERIATLKPLIETIDRVTPEIEAQERLKSNLLSKEGNAPNEAQRKEFEKSRLAVNAWITILNNQVAEARAALAPHLTSACHWAREICCEHREAAHAKAKAKWSKHMDARRADNEACQDGDVRVIDDTLMYLEKLGVDPYERAKRLVAMLEMVIEADAANSAPKK
jgi:hypothetical protein